MDFIKLTSLSIHEAVYINISKIRCVVADPSGGTVLMFDGESKIIVIEHIDTIMNKLKEVGVIK
mgnify:CR=1 FL=1